MIGDLLASALDQAERSTPVRRYPKGRETILEEVQARRKSSAGKSCGGFIFAGSSHDRLYAKSLLQASQDGDFSSPMGHALERYQQDIATPLRNDSPREFWPSTGMFRTILFSAGKRLGDDAVIFLERIPDPDLRLFAQIELAAALAGLPEFVGIQRDRRPRPVASVGVADPIIKVGETSGSGPEEPRIRCPKCQWTPRKESRWACKCGHVWNTFDTGGVCPACLYQWKITACLRCHEFSAHSDWYTHA